MARILAFSGSNGSASINQQLVIYAAGMLEKCRPEVISLRDFPAPLYSMDIEVQEGFPESMIRLNGLIDSRDGFLISLPEHNGSVTPVFKNTVDWLSRIEHPVFNSKALCLLSASPGIRGGAHNLEQIIALIPFWGGNVVSSYSLGKFYDKWDAARGCLRDEAEIMKLRKALNTFEKELYI